MLFHMLRIHVLCIAIFVYLTAGNCFSSPVEAHKISSIIITKKAEAPVRFAAEQIQKEESKGSSLTSKTTGSKGFVPCFTASENPLWKNNRLETSSAAAARPIPARKAGWRRGLGVSTVARIRFHIQPGECLPLADPPDCGTNHLKEDSMSRHLPVSPCARTDSTPVT